MSTKENPTDLASRGGLVEQGNDLCWHGPKWSSEPSAWPADITTTATSETLAEAKTAREVFKHAPTKRWTRLTQCFTSTAFGAHCALPRG